MKITESSEEKIAIAHRLIDDVNAVKPIYTPLMMEKMNEQIDHYCEGRDLSQSEKEALLYNSIYDYWVYGCSIDE